MNYKDYEKILIIETLYEMEILVDTVVDSCIDFDIEDIYYKYRELEKLVHSKVFFLQNEPMLKILSLLEKLEGLTDMALYECEYSLDIGVHEKMGFLVNDIQLMIMQPYIKYVRELKDDFRRDFLGGVA